MPIRLRGFHAAADLVDEIRRIGIPMILNGMAYGGLEHFLFQWQAKTQGSAPKNRYALGVSPLLDLPAFQTVVDETIATLPPQFQEKLENVMIVIEHTQSKGMLLGLYEGIPVTEWGRDFSGKLPDKITLFQEAIEQYAQSPEEIPHVIRETLLHEIGHHFGLDHRSIGKMEKRWRLRR